jgi:hypothetical protein
MAATSTASTEEVLFPSAAAEAHVRSPSPAQPQQAETPPPAAAFDEEEIRAGRAWARRLAQAGARRGRDSAERSVSDAPDRMAARTEEALFPSVAEMEAETEAEAGPITPGPFIAGLCAVDVVCGLRVALRMGGTPQAETAALARVRPGIPASPIDVLRALAAAGAVVPPVLVAGVAGPRHRRAAPGDVGPFLVLARGSLGDEPPQQLEVHSPLSMEFFNLAWVVAVPRRAPTHFVLCRPEPTLDWECAVFVRGRIVPQESQPPEDWPLLSPAGADPTRRKGCGRSAVFCACGGRCEGGATECALCLSPARRPPRGGASFPSLVRRNLAPPPAPAANTLPLGSPAHAAPLQETCTLCGAEKPCGLACACRGRAVARRSLLDEEEDDAFWFPAAREAPAVREATAPGAAAATLVEVLAVPVAPVAAALQEEVPAAPAPAEEEDDPWFLAPAAAAAKGKDHPLSLAAIVALTLPRFCALASALSSGVALPEWVEEVVEVPLVLPLVVAFPIARCGLSMLGDRLEVAGAAGVLRKRRTGVMDVEIGAVLFRVPASAVSFVAPPVRRTGLFAAAPTFPPADDGPPPAPGDPNELLAAAMAQAAAVVVEEDAFLPAGVVGPLLESLLPLGPGTVLVSLPRVSRLLVATHMARLVLGPNSVPRLLLFVALVLCRLPRGGRSGAAILARRCRQFFDGEFTTLTEERRALCRRSSPGFVAPTYLVEEDEIWPSGCVAPPRPVVLRAVRQIRAGLVAKANRTLQCAKTASGPSAATVLRGLHPPASDPVPPIPLDAPKVEGLTPAAVLRSLRSFAPGSAPGPTGIAPDLLLELVEGSAGIFLPALTSLTQRLANGEVPAAMVP